MSDVVVSIQLESKITTVEGEVEVKYANYSIMRGIPRIDHRAAKVGTGKLVFAFDLENIQAYLIERADYINIFGNTTRRFKCIRLHMVLAP